MLTNNMSYLLDSEQTTFTKEFNLFIAKQMKNDKIYYININLFPFYKKNKCRSLQVLCMPENNH